MIELLAVRRRCGRHGADTTGYARSLGDRENWQLRVTHNVPLATVPPTRRLYLAPVFYTNKSGRCRQHLRLAGHRCSTSVSLTTIYLLLLVAPSLMTLDAGDVLDEELSIQRSFKPLLAQ